MPSRLFVARGPEWYEIWLSRPQWTSASTRKGGYWSSNNKTSTDYVCLIAEDAWKRMRLSVELEIGECVPVALEAKTLTKALL